MAKNTQKISKKRLLWLLQLWVLGIRGCQSLQNIMPTQLPLPFELVFG